MEDKKIHDEELGQEIEYEEAEDVEDGNELQIETPSEKQNKQPVNRTKFYFILAAGIALIVVIVVGWYYFFKLNMKKINEEIQNKTTQTSDQALEQLKQTYEQAKDVIEKADQGIDQLRQDIKASGSYEVR